MQNLTKALNIVVVFLIVVAVHCSYWGQLWSIKVYLTLFEASIVVIVVIVYFSNICTHQPIRSVNILKVYFELEG